MKIKKIINELLITFFIILFANYTNVNAASVTIDVPNSVTVGDTITAKVSGKAEQWDLTLKANGTTIASSNNLTNEGSEISISASGTYNAKETGKVTFTLTGDYSYTVDGAVKTQEINITKTVSVNEKKQEEPVSTSAETPSNTKTETPTTKPTEAKQEITFTAASGTVYTTVDSLNFRSVSDGSIIGSISAKGTALERTGTASGKVRVKYNGREGYVSSNYVTTTKPEEKKEEEKKEEPKETAKSNNANLKTLVVDGQTLTPVFSANTTSYSLQVGKDVESLEIKAEAEDSKATVTVDGNKSLKEGKNTVAVSVSAEDGTIKIYEIDVQKAQKEEKLGLKSLKIEGTNIFSEFKSSIYSYDIDIEPDVEKLEIEAIANNEEATVEVLGNEDLQEENTITIMVSSKDGTEKVTYQINANKKQKTVVEATEKKGLDSKVYVFIGAGAFVLVALIIVVTYTIKHRNQDDDFYDDEDDFEYEDEQQKTDITSDNTDNFENVQDSDLDDITYRETPRHKRGKHF